MGVEEKGLEEVEKELEAVEVEEKRSKAEAT